MDIDTALEHEQQMNNNVVSEAPSDNRKEPGVGDGRS